MKFILVIAIVNIIYVRGKAIDNSADVIEDKLIELAVEAEDGYPEGENEKIRLPRQPGYYEGVPNHIVDNPSARTISAGLQKTLSFGIGGGLGGGQPSLLHAPAQPPPMQYQSVPYVAGYSLMPVYAHRHIPIAPPPPPPMPCPMQAMAAPQSLPLFSINKHFSVGIGRNAENENEYVPYPVDHQNPQAYMSMVDPSLIARAAKAAEQNMYIEPPYQLEGQPQTNYIPSPHKRETDIALQSILS